MRDHTKRELERVIRRAEVWAGERCYVLSLTARHPRICTHLDTQGYAHHRYSTERERYQSYHVDALMQVAYALLHGEDLRYALRMALNAAEWAGRVSGELADSSWHDAHSTVTQALEECLGLLNDHTPNRGA